MSKLYFGNQVAIISTFLLGANIGYILWGFLNRMAIQKWGLIILFWVILHGLFWYFANIRDLYSNSIVYATNGTGESGLFSVGSIQSIIFWVASVITWILVAVSVFKPQYRKNIFCIIAVISMFQIVFIEYSRIHLYYSIPASFDYM